MATDAVGTAAAWNASFIPSAARDILLAVPRLAQRAGSFALFHMPEAVDNIAGKIFHGGSLIADATVQTNATITETSHIFAQSTAAGFDAALTGALRAGEEEVASTILGTISQGFLKLKTFGGIFSYLTSKWALATFTAAIVLNRTQFYASSRAHLRLRWHMRLMLYMVPISAFMLQTLYILQALKCQTSPDFAALRYGDPLKHLSIDFGGEGGFLYRLSSALLPWQDDAACCDARHMSVNSVNSDHAQLRGSMSLLFWFFVTLCTSQFFETLVCALQGRQPVPETGMTIFEHSLAFAECEAMISSVLGLGLFGMHREGSPSAPTDGSTVIRITKGELMQRLNMPPEVLLVCLISCFSHMSSAVLAIVGQRHRVRLVNTALWSCCYMAAFFWSFIRVVSYSDDQASDLGILRFPTVCIVGFIPHMLIIVGILVCEFIYGLALVVTAFSIPEEAAAGLSFRQRFYWAFQNLQANVQFSSASSIRIKMSEDFYTTLLKIGFNILTAASEAVYLNEGSRIHVASMTWLERKRIDEVNNRFEQRKTLQVPSELLGDSIARGVGFVDHQNMAIGRSPYARERRSKPTTISERDQPHPGDIDSGLGMTQRRSRINLTLAFLGGIFWLIVSLHAQAIIGVSSRLGIHRIPAWLRKAAGLAFDDPNSASQPRPARISETDFWMIGTDGNLTVPKDEEIDVEIETRRRLQKFGSYTDEQGLDDTLYSWWRGGGWFGTIDNSGDYNASNIDDDATSVVSTSTNVSTADDWSDVDSGRRTPTQLDPLGVREATPDGEVDLASLARLLNPQSAEDREEARLLSYRLQSRRPVTRAQYRRDTERDRTRLLQGLRGAQPDALSEEEEERTLEQFILAQRAKASSTAQTTETWESGASGMGAGGPQCVVCQSMPRTVLVWPCGCLSMCDDCRIGLAARNYTKCICCRTEIAAYSRLYVP